MSHFGVTCDGCRKPDFSGIRYKCHVCPDYDLCETCASAGIVTGSHAPSHPMEQISAGRQSGEFDFFLRDASSWLESPNAGVIPVGRGGGISMGRGRGRGRGRGTAPAMMSRSLRGGRSPFPSFSYGQLQREQNKHYTCPYCADWISESKLAEHVLSLHRSEQKAMVCPICAARPGGDPNFISKDFHGHLQLRHQAKGRGGKGVGFDFGRSPQHRSPLMKRSLKSNSNKYNNNNNNNSNSLASSAASNSSLSSSTQSTAQKKKDEKEQKEDMSRAFFVQELIFSSLLP